MTNKRVSVLLSLCLFGGAVAWAQCPSIPSCKYSYTIGSDGYSVHFEGETSCEGNLVLTWDFGDGATDVSSGASLNLEPTHIYSAEGKYVVKMTVTLPDPNSACKHTHTEVIEIEGGSPDYFTATLNGPTLAAECQEVIFTAYAAGGVPPYTYTWDLGPDYCYPGCPNTCVPFVQTNKASVSATYAPGHNGSTNTIYVTVTDATNNAPVICSLDLKVKPFFHLPEIFVEGEMSCNNDGYGIGSQIMFIPDIVPLSAFEYPTNYFWDFGDGNTYLDNFDGGGFAIHTYTLQAGASYPRQYTVKLTISDPYGSIQAVTTIWVCDPDSPGGGGGSGDGDSWELSNGTNSPTKVIALPDNGLPSSVSISMYNTDPNDCASNIAIRWKWEFVDINANGAPEVILNTLPEPNQILFRHCVDPGQYYQPHDNAYFSYPVVLTNDGFGFCPWANPGEIDNKVWGCLSVQGNAWKTNSNQPPNNLAELCDVEVNPCLVYIKPSEMTVEVETSGACRDYSVSAKVEGGGWRKSVVNGVTKYMYKEYVWKAYDINNLKEEVDILLPVPGDPGRMRINVDHPYFDQFGPDNYAEFYVKLIVGDHANQSVETNQLILFNPFRLHVAPEQTRCPGVLS